MTRQAACVSSVYDAAAAYALAFSYRDIPAEVDAILGWAEPVVGRRIESVIELAAGPADHSREMAARGVRATALDITPAMTAYAAAQASAHRQRLQTVTADMCDFAIDERFDLAIMMIDSIAYILDEESLDAHFRCVATHLNERGCYIIEASHPADSINDQALTQTAWTQTGDGESASIRWGEPGDPSDAAPGITPVTVTIEHHREGHNPVVIRDIELQHAWVDEQLNASIARVGGFVARGWYGSFDGVALDDAAAWRMIAVLQRC